MSDWLDKGRVRLTRMFGCYMASFEMLDIAVGIIVRRQASLCIFEVDFRPLEYLLSDGGANIRDSYRRC